MKCSLCKSGSMQPGVATLTLERAGTIVVIRDAPALVCDQCGDRVFDEKVTGVALRMASEAADRGTQFEVVQFPAGKAQVAA